MARRGNPARLVIALSVAAVLAVFLLYTSIAGGGTPSLRPSSLSGHDGKVSLTGRVLKPVSGDAHGAGLRFRSRECTGEHGRSARDGEGEPSALRHAHRPQLYRF